MRWDNIVEIILISICFVVLGFSVYVMAGFPKLWGRERGVPFCGHPFEQTWGREMSSWTCPKCSTLFVIEVYPSGHRQWVPK